MTHQGNASCELDDDDRKIVGKRSKSAITYRSGAPWPLLGGPEGGWGGWPRARKSTRNGGGSGRSRGTATRCYRSAGGSDRASSAAIASRACRVSAASYRPSCWSSRALWSMIRWTASGGGFRHGQTAQTRIHSDHGERPASKDRWSKGKTVRWSPSRGCPLALRGPSVARCRELGVQSPLGTDSLRHVRTSGVPLHPLMFPIRWPR